MGNPQSPCTVWVIVADSEPASKGMATEASKERVGLGRGVIRVLVKSRILTLIHQHKEVEVVIVPQHVSPRINIHIHQMGAWESLPDQDAILRL